MKRGKPPERKTPMPRGESELKRTEFPKRSQPLRSTPSPKLSGSSLSRAARSLKQRKPLPTSRPRVPREEVELVQCACWCGQWIKAIDKRGNPRRFAAHHYLAPHLSEVWARLLREDDGPSDECWEWPGGINNKGYGVTKRNGENYAHRAAWTQVNGLIPDGLDVCHHCDNPPCIRPRHLFLGTAVDNMQDMARKGRTGHGTPRPLDLPAVIAAYEAGVPQRQLPRMFKASQERIRRELVAAGVALRLDPAEAKTKPRPTHCSAGHAFSETNTYIHQKTGLRHCRKCRSARSVAAKSAERRARRVTASRSGGICECCSQEPATDMHHRKNRSQGGKWCPSNLMHLSHAHHMWITEHPARAREMGWSVLSSQEPAAIPVQHARHGLVLLGSDGSVTPTTREAA